MKIYNYNPTTNIYSGSSEADISPLDPEAFIVPAFATTIEVPEYNIETEYLVFENGQWIVKQFAIPEPQPELTLEQLTQNKIQEIRTEGANRLEQIANPYVLGERLTWAIQLEEAAKYLSDNTANTPFIDQLAIYRNITKADLVTKIMENANAFRAASGMILGIQQKLLDQIDLITTKEELDAITWPE